MAVRFTRGEAPPRVRAPESGQTPATEALLRGDRSKKIAQEALSEMNARVNQLSDVMVYADWYAFARETGALYAAQDDPEALAGMLRAWWRANG